MSVIAATRTKTGPGREASFITWPDLGDADTGSLEITWGFADKSVQVYGTFAGATVTIKGTNVNDVAQGVQLHDLQGNLLTFTSLGLKPVLENVAYIFPVTSGGAGADISVVVFGN